MIEGTPAITNTLPSWKPGAFDTGLAISVAPSGNAGHAQARLVQGRAALVLRLEDRARIVSHIDVHAERGGHSVGGLVVMGRADAAGGEDVIVFRPQLVQGGDDLTGRIGNDPRLRHLHAERGQELGDGLQVHVLGAPGQQFVADKKNSGFDLALGHGAMIAARRLHHD
jgi:hypothetical protein